MKTPYDDIIRLPHHVSQNHPQMPLRERAAQFAPFAALTDYEAAVGETDRRRERDAQEGQSKCVSVAGPQRERDSGNGNATFSSKQLMMAKRKSFSCHSRSVWNRSLRNFVLTCTAWIASSGCN